MKIGYLVQPNLKGQIVIPHQIRKKLGISAQTTLNLLIVGKGMYCYPVEEVITKVEKESSYLDLLKLTAGAWAGDSWQKQRERKRKIELKASQRRKKQW